LARDAHRIVVIGGGAGGLELATRLGDKLGKRGRAEVILVDRSRTHLWKPLLHEVAAGSMNIHDHQLDYIAQARWHGFRFVLGNLAGLDRAGRQVTIAPVVDDEGAEILPERRIPYDTLVIAIGSESNDFGTPGFREFAFALETKKDANLFHRRLVNACARANYAADGRVIDIAIVGAGATGVELAAELHNTTRLLAAFGLTNFDPEKQIRISLIEAGPRILPGLVEYLAEATAKILGELGVRQLVGERVVAIGESAIQTASGKSIPSDFTVWAAGIRCQGVLKEIGALETNRINQLAVRQTLQATRDEDIFAIGDCAACAWTNGRFVPPRAQAAHQQASHVFASIKRRLAGKAPKDFHYRDFGSLVSLGTYESVGTLMGFVTGGSIRLEGLLAKLFYVSLYRMHILALHGFWRMALDTLARLIRSQTEPKVKLH
jgi:NADH dehydrogenase